jgi:hypothetical protein
MNAVRPTGKGSIPGLPDINPDDFPGVKIKLSKWATWVDSGWFDARTNTIHLPRNASNSFAQHEYGHYLQSLNFPAKQYSAIERASFLNAVKNKLGFGKDHNTFWTELDANKRSGEFFGPSAPINWKSNEKYNWPR